MPRKRFSRVRVRSQRQLANRNRAETRDFKQIQRDCSSALGEGRLYEDPEFPANAGSLFCTSYDRPSNADDIEWLRPHDICDIAGSAEPQLYVGGHSRFDIVQGQLGDCWLLAAMAAISQHDELMRIVLPEGQSFDDDYCGAFLVQIWQYQKWVDVIVDDRLPCVNGRLIYISSADNNEFWSAIIEKAYAKLNGSYEALKGGSTSEALSDFTSGVPESFELGDYGQIGQSVPKDLFKTLQKSFKRGAVGGCSVEVSGAGIEADAGRGLIAGHAYTLSTVAELVDADGRNRQLLCIRNPWGQAEWDGRWSDESPEWDTVDEGAAGITQEDKEDGEFWMEFSDFIYYFSKVELCIIPDEIVADEGCNWQTSLQECKWQPGITAGGCTNFPNTFWRNPQFQMHLTDVDDDSSTDCSFIISLIQMDPDRRRKGKDLLVIGFIVYKLDDDHVNVAREPVSSQFFKTHRSVARSDFINAREVTKRGALPPGNYLIVPCTFEPDQGSQFIMRIFTEKKQDLTHTTQDTQIEEEQKPDRPISEENEERFHTFFEQLAGRDKAISASELQDILNRVSAKCYGLSGEIFEMETCRALIAAGDTQFRGKLNYNNFKNVWLGVRKWMETFIKFDEDSSGSFDSYELRDALRSVGIVLSTAALEIIIMRYGNESLRITISDFVLMAVRLKSAIKTYNRIRPDVSVDEWIKIMLYC